MKFEYLTPPVALTVDNEGKIIDCIARIKSDDPYTILTGKLQGDWTNRSKEDVIDAVLEYNYKLLYVNRAMAESVLVVEDMKNKVEDFEKLTKEKMDEVDKALEKIEVNNKEQLDLAVADLTNLIVGMMSGTTNEEESKDVDAE